MRTKYEEYMDEVLSVFPNKKFEFVCEMRSMRKLVIRVAEESQKDVRDRIVDMLYELKKRLATAGEEENKLGIFGVSQLIYNLKDVPHAPEKTEDNQES